MVIVSAIPNPIACPINTDIPMHIPINIPCPIPINNPTPCPILSPLFIFMVNPISSVNAISDPFPFPNSIFSYTLSNLLTFIPSSRHILIFVLLSLSLFLDIYRNSTQNFFFFGRLY